MGADPEARQARIEALEITSRERGPDNPQVAELEALLSP
jgi:hypothetical protein